jgi:peptidyl-prolyl cis-trans isomerase D
MQPDDSPAPPLKSEQNCVASAMAATSVAGGHSITSHFGAVPASRAFSASTCSMEVLTPFIFQLPAASGFIFISQCSFMELCRAVITNRNVVSIPLAARGPHFYIEARHSPTETPMLTTLRSKTGGWIAKIFIGLLAASFAVWGIEDMLRGRVSDELARVGERVISTTEYSEQFNQQLRVYSQRLNETVTPDRARELGLDRQILGDLMRDAALDSQATELGIRMPAKAVAQSIADTPRFQSADGSFNANAFRQLLRANGLSEQQFFAAEAQNMTRQVISQPLTALAVVPDTLVELIWKHRSEQRDAKWFEITVPADAAKEPSDADLKKYYDENPVAFAQPELRTFAVVALTPEAIASRIEVSEDDLKRQYEADKSKYTTEETRSVLQIPFPNEAEAQAALDKIKAGTSFEDVARERGLTEADMSLGTVAKAPFRTAIADAAFALEDGAVSGVVKGRLSTVLLKAKIEQQGATRTLEEVKDQVTKDAQARLARDRLLDLHDKFEDARAGGASMDEAAGEINCRCRPLAPLRRTAMTQTTSRFRCRAIPAR